LPAKLKTQFAVSPHSNAAASFRGKVFRSITKDVSMGGVCILVQDVSLLELPSGSHLRIVVAIPQPQSLVRSVGLVRNIVRTVQGTDNGRLCVAFSAMRQDEREKLKQFIAVQVGI
jgi:c-di-GMP-binding flagellar brake protein YcgR